MDAGFAVAFDEVDVSIVADNEVESVERLRSFERFDNVFGLVENF